MADGLRIVMAGEPVGKGRPRFSRKSGHVYTPEKTARYEERLAWAAQAEMRGKPLFTDALTVSITAYMSLPASKPKAWREAALLGIIRPVKKPDLDNFAKVVDACNKVVWLDDSQIVRLVVEKYYSDQPRMEIVVAPLFPA
jgi:Holliday junction resolvase RusA-like endonuclease